ncbi:MAG: IspD/TarI family cytidylyltransferase [Trueperaceae bacterium]|nr:IspD/TarI family cytidylyltransferase [Trueperaceae bacterium]
MSRATSSVAALVPAAGSGSRLGLGPKAFVRLAGRTLIEHAAWLLAGEVDEVLIAVPDGWVADAARLVPHARVLLGGQTRQETVERLASATDAEWVVVHDAARPLTPGDVVRRVLEAAQRAGAASAAVEVADTLHDTDLDAPVAREALRAVQTPQAFARRRLLEAHRSARVAGTGATDDAQLIRAAGGTVELVPGSPWSHKLTRAADLPWLEAVARGRDAVSDGS